MSSLTNDQLELRELKNSSVLKKQNYNKKKSFKSKFCFCCVISLILCLLCFTLLCYFSFLFVIVIMVLEFLIKKYLNTEKWLSDYIMDTSLIIINYFFFSFFVILFCCCSNILTNLIVHLICKIKYLKKNEKFERLKESL